MSKNSSESENLGVLNLLAGVVPGGVSLANQGRVLQDIHIFRFCDGKPIEHHFGALNPENFEMLLGEPIASLTLK